jgi:hypothetical protein
LWRGAANAKPIINSQNFYDFTGESRAAVRRGGNSEAGYAARLRKKEERPTKRKKENKTMNGTVMQAVLWIVAGLFLTLLIIRRGKRKASKT